MCVLCCFQTQIDKGVANLVSIDCCLIFLLPALPLPFLSFSPSPHAVFLYFPLSCFPDVYNTPYLFAPVSISNPICLACWPITSWIIKIPERKHNKNRYVISLLPWFSDWIVIKCKAFALALSVISGALRVFECFRHTNLIRCAVIQLKNHEKSGIRLNISQQQMWIQVHTTNTINTFRFQLKKLQNADFA